MKTKTPRGSGGSAPGRAGGATEAYLELARSFPLLPIDDDAGLDRAIARLDELLDGRRDDPDPQVRGYISALGTLIEAYETDRFPEPESDPAGMIAHLIEAKGTTQADVARATGLSKATLSQIVSGARKPSRRAIGALAEHFDVDPGLFL